MKTFPCKTFDANVLNIDLNMRAVSHKECKDHNIEYAVEPPPRNVTCKPRFAENRAKSLCTGFAMLLSVFVIFHIVLHSKYLAVNISVSLLLWHQMYFCIPLPEEKLWHVILLFNTSLLTLLLVYEQEKDCMWVLFLSFEIVFVHVSWIIWRDMGIGILLGVSLMCVCLNLLFFFVHVFMVTTEGQVMNMAWNIVASLLIIFNVYVYYFIHIQKS